MDEPKTTDASVPICETSGIVRIPRTYLTAAEQLRVEALRAAVDDLAGNEDGRTTIQRAQEFERYLRGEIDPPVRPDPVWQPGQAYRPRNPGPGYQPSNPPNVGSGGSKPSNN